MPLAGRQAGLRKLGRHAGSGLEPGVHTRDVGRNPALGVFGQPVEAELRGVLKSGLAHQPVPGDTGFPEEGRRGPLSSMPLDLQLPAAISRSIAPLGEGEFMNVVRPKVRNTIGVPIYPDAHLETPTLHQTEPVDCTRR